VLFAALVPGQDPLTITAVVLVLGAVAVIAVTRGRLSANR